MLMHDKLLDLNSKNYPSFYRLAGLGLIWTDV